MKIVKYRLKGLCPLLLNNPETVNPQSPIAKEIKKLTDTRKKTDEIHEDILKLKFLASIYVNDKGQYILPCDMQRASFIAAAKEKRLGAKFERSMFVTKDALLEFANKNESPEELYENYRETYMDVRAVGVNGSKIPASRFIVPEWSIENELTFDPGQINQADLIEAMEVAGLRYGIGTYRSKFGKYEVEVLSVYDEHSEKKGSNDKWKK